VVLFDAAARRRLSEELLAVKEGYVLSVAFSPDGKTSAAGCSVRGGGAVVLLDASVESWQRIARTIANRNFIWDEWRQYFLDRPYRPTFPDLPEPPEVASRASN